MADYGRDYRGGHRSWFQRWFGGDDEGRGYDRGYGRDYRRGGYDRGFRGGYTVPERYGFRAGRGPVRGGYGRGYDQEYGRTSRGGGGWWNPGQFVDEAWGGGYARGDNQFQGRRIYGDDYRAIGRPGYQGGYDRAYERDDPGYGWRRPFRGYDRGW